MSDDADVVRRLLDRAEWHEAEARRIRAAADVVTAELGVPRPSKSRARRTRPPGANTITGTIVTLLEGEAREWPLAEIRDALVDRGLNADDDNVRTAARRLSERGDITKIRTGVYAANSTATTEQPTPPVAVQPVAAPAWSEATTNEPHMAVVG